MMTRSLGPFVGVCSLGSAEAGVVGGIVVVVVVVVVVVDGFSVVVVEVVDFLDV